MNISDQNEHLLILYREMRELHKRATMLCDSVKRECKQAAQPGPVVDAVFTLKKTQQYVEGTRKELNKTLDFLQRLGAMFAVQTEDNKLTGELSSGYANTSQAPLMPDRDGDPAAYHELCSAIGLDPNNRAAKPSFSGVQAFATKLGEEGRPLPEGLAHCRVLDKFSVVARARAGVDIDVLSDYIVGNRNPNQETNDGES